MSAERWTRPDISAAQNDLQRGEHRWSVALDDSLVWLMDYLRAQPHKVMLGFFDTRDVNSMRIAEITDASLADDRIDLRSTLSYSHFLYGRHSFSLYSWKSKTSTSVEIATSVTELQAKVLSVRDVQGEQALAEALLEKKVGVDGFMDNNGALCTLRSGGVSTKNAALKGAYVSDFYDNENNTLSYESGKTIHADGGTKHLSADDRHRIDMESLLVDLRVALDLKIGDSFKVFDEVNGEAAAFSTDLGKGVRTKEEKRKAQYERDKRRMANVENARKMMRERYPDATEGWIEAALLLPRDGSKSVWLHVMRDLLKQRKKGQSSDGVSEKREGFFGGDSHGPIKPVGYDGSRYVHVFVYEKNGNIRGYPVRSKHSSWSAASFKKHLQWVKKEAKGWVSDGGKEYEGEFEDLLLMIKCMQRETFKYDPQSNGQQEVAVQRWLEDTACALAMGGEAPTNLWVLAGGHADDVRALLDGSWKDLHGMASEAFVLRNFAPWSSVVTFNIAGPLLDVDVRGNSFQNRAQKGFLCGWEPDGHRIRVAYYTNGRLRVTETRNFKIHPIMFFGDPIPGARDIQFTGPVRAVSSKIAMRAQLTAEDGEGTERFKIYQCGDCGLFRSISEWEVIQEIISEFGDIPTCADAGLSCNEGICAVAGDADLLKRYYEKDLVLYADEAVIQMSRTITKKEAFLPQNLEKTLAAIDKEKGKYESFGAYGEKIYEWDEVVAKNPDALRVWLGIVYVWKYLEDDVKRTIAARFCAFGNAVLNRDGLVVDGFREDEISWSSTPTPAGIKLQIGCAKVKGHRMSFGDYRGAYLQAPLEENAPDIYCTLPREMQSEAERNMKNPVRKVLKALYGLMRGGDDYDRYARAQEKKVGWKSLRPEGHPAFSTRRV